jgi:cation:H+ antiporter
MSFVIFVLSVAFLLLGADLLVRESERLAIRLRVSEFTIGAILIALGTSLPEMAVGILAGYGAKPELAIGSIVGSTILNNTLILGLIFIFTHKTYHNMGFFAKDSNWVIISVLVFVLMALDGVVSRFDAFLLLLLMTTYILFLVKDAKSMIMQQTHEAKQELPPKEDNGFFWPKTISLLLFGFALIAGGADFAIESALDIAKTFHISHWIIGITLVAIGTSLPELIVSISAAIKGKTNISIGSIIGSSTANITAVLGSAALAKPLQIDMPVHLFDIATMIIATLMLVFLTINKLYSKPAGITLLIMFVLFIEHTITP